MTALFHKISTLVTVLVRGNKPAFPNRNPRLVMRFLPFHGLKIEIKTLSLLYSSIAPTSRIVLLLSGTESVKRSLIEGETVSEQVMCFTKFYCNHRRLSPATAVITHAAVIRANTLLVQKCIYSLATDIFSCRIFFKSKIVLFSARI
jgi:hypothetical protein